MNFTLDPQGGQIGLARKKAEEYIYIDTLVYAYQHENVSTGRVNDGVRSWTNFTEPTPGQCNSCQPSAIPVTEKTTFIVYPNPVSEGTLYFNNVRNVRLFSSSGVLVKAGIHTDHLDVSSLTPGLYILKTDQAEVFRIVIN